MTEQLAKWDSAEYLKTEEDMANYLDACMEEAGDAPAFIAKALGTIARARGRTQVARNAGLSDRRTAAKLLKRMRSVQGGIPAGEQWQLVAVLMTSRSNGQMLPSHILGKKNGPSSGVQFCTTTGGRDPRNQRSIYSTNS
ncbi:addiction module antidote protein [Pseudomonas gingeri]|uniref:addiction module antidote protein n=1 Tax=Pseudomonas gingeri TaxID=117681 RepID=UPI003F883A9B